MSLYYKIYRSRQDIIKTIIILIYFFITTYIGSLAVSAADRFNLNGSLPPENKSAPLFDPLFNGLSDFRQEIDPYYPTPSPSSTSTSLTTSALSSPLSNTAARNITTSSTSLNTNDNHSILIKSNEVIYKNNSDKDKVYIAQKISSFWSILFPWKTLADTLVLLAVFMILLRSFTLGKFSLTFLRRNLVIIGTLYLLRAPFLILTVIPSPAINCVARPVDPIALDALLIQFQIRKACGDVFWSGHSILLTIALLNWISKSRHYFYFCGHFMDLSQSIQLYRYPYRASHHRHSSSYPLNRHPSSTRSHTTNSTVENNIVPGGCQTTSDLVSNAHIESDSIQAQQHAELDGGVMIEMEVISNHNLLSYQDSQTSLIQRTIPNSSTIIPPKQETQDGSSIVPSPQSFNDQTGTRHPAIEISAQQLASQNQSQSIFGIIPAVRRAIPRKTILKIKALSCLERTFQFMMWIIWIEGCLALVYGTLHYTIDVVIGVLFSWSIWTIYHLGIFYDPIFQNSFFFKWTVMVTEYV